jgi:hypothetical protein
MSEGFIAQSSKGPCGPFCDSEGLLFGGSAPHGLDEMAAAWLPNGDAGWSSPVARQAHNLKVVGSNPTPATKKISKLMI